MLSILEVKKTMGIPIQGQGYYSESRLQSDNRLASIMYSHTTGLSEEYQLTIQHECAPPNLHIHMCMSATLKNITGK